MDVRHELTRVGLAGLDARFVMQTEWPTPSTPEEFARALANTVTTFRSAHPDMIYEGVGVSLPGRVDEAGMLVFAPNLGWRSVNVRGLLESTIDLPVVLENAASACALAELWFGRHPDNVKHLVAVTVSEGVGVGLLLNAQLFHGTDSLAGELGHVTSTTTGRAVPAANADAGSSTPPMPRRWRATTPPCRRARAKPAGARQRARWRRSATSCDWRKRGDRRAGETLDEMARYLGIGLAPIVTALAPQVVVIIGEITAAWSRVGPIIEETVRSRSMSLVKTRIVPTDPATQPRLRGAVTLVVQQHFGVANVA